MEQRGVTWGFTLNFLILFVLMITVVFVFLTDFQQIVNSKQIIDKEFKRSISVAMVEYIDDNSSSDRIATITPEKQEAFRNRVKILFLENNKKYNIDLNLESFNLELSDKVYFRYNGFFNFKTSINKLNIPIKIRGRSKAQRFDGL